MANAIVQVALQAHRLLVEASIHPLTIQHHQRSDRYQVALLVTKAEGHRWSRRSATTILRWPR
jgi:hypothetical protein